MKRIVSAGTIGKTNHCQKNFQCLTDLDGVCEVEYLVKRNILSIICKHTENCNYQSVEKGLLICNCPTRLELNRKYRI
jgi:hypothetical protein